MTRTIISAVVAGGAIIALIAIAEATFGFELATRLGNLPRVDTITGVTRVSGPFEIPEVLALTLLVTLALTIYWTQSERTKASWLGWASATLQALAIGLTFFRAAWIGAATVVVASIAVRPGQPRRLITAAAVSGVGGIVAFAALSHIPVFAKRLTSDFATANAYFRVATDIQSLRLFAHQPLFGVGADRYPIAAMKLKAPEFLGVPALPFAHSSYLGLLAEQGLVGFLPFLALTVLAVVAVREVGRTRATADDILFYASIVGAGLAYFVMALTLTMLPYAPSNAFLALLLGLVGGRLNARASGEVREPLATEDPGPQLTVAALQRRLRGQSWILIFAGSQMSAAEFAAPVGTFPVLTLGKADLYDRRLQGLRGTHADAAVLLLPSWERQRNREFFAAALALSRANGLFVVDCATGRARKIDAAGRFALLLSLPLSVATAAGRIVVEVARFEVRRRTDPKPRRLLVSRETCVLAVWLGGEDSQVGGSVTHLSGILSGLKAAGVKVALLTAHEPPAQLSTVADYVQLIPPVKASARLTGDVERMAINHPALVAGRKLAARLQPTFIYQRHQPFLTAGCDIALEADVPFVLEWNASEVWVRKHWDRPVPIEGFLDPLLAARERYVLKRSTLVAAVSDPAKAMALRLGLDPARILVLPNAVDVSEVDRAVKAEGPIDPVAKRLGWIGSFGPWHGAEIAIRALAQLPSELELLMIGVGEQLTQCQALAEKLGVAGRVTWTGLLPHDVALRRLAACAILLSPHVRLPGQEFFGSPTKLFEYMALARPIVASRLGQIGEVLEDERTALLVEPGDVSALAGAVMRVVNAPALGISLAAAARREAIERHTWNARADQLLGALGRVDQLIHYA